MEQAGSERARGRGRTGAGGRRRRSRKTLWRSFSGRGGIRMWFRRAQLFIVLLSVFRFSFLPPWKRIHINFITIFQGRQPRVRRISGPSFFVCKHIVHAGVILLVSVHTLSRKIVLLTLTTSTGVTDLNIS